MKAQKYVDDWELNLPLSPRARIPEWITEALGEELSAHLEEIRSVLLQVARNVEQAERRRMVN